MKKTTRQIILDTAITAITKKSYNSISMQELADACGITKPAIYYHFKSKEELFFELFRETTGRFKQLIRNELASDRPISKSLEIMESEIRGNSDSMSVIARAHIAFATDPELLSLFPDIQLLVQEGLHLLEDLFKKGMQSNELRSDLDTASAARLFSSVLHSVMIENRINEKAIEKNSIPLFLTLLYDGIKSKADESGEIT